MATRRSWSAAVASTMPQCPFQPSCRAIRVAALPGASRTSHGAAALSIGSRLPSNRQADSVAAWARRPGKPSIMAPSMTA